jgi:hypothetical protein
MDRKEVYRAIDGERRHQDIRWADFDDKNNHPADWVIYIEKHLDSAKGAIYNSHDMDKFGAEMRKIAALAVACGEQHGMPDRYQ